MSSPTDTNKNSAPSTGNTTDTTPTPSSPAPAPANATKKSSNSPSSAAAAGPGSPARQRSGGGRDRRRSSSRGASGKNQTDASPSTPGGGEKKPQQPQGQQHGRRQSRSGGASGGGNRRGSAGAQQQQKKDNSPTSGGGGGASVPSETLSNLKNLISDLRETAPPLASSATGGGGGPSPGSAPASPARTRQGHRKNTSSHASNIPPSISAPPPAPSSGHSTLNPTAGGFLPHLQNHHQGGGGSLSLGPIHDMIDEGLVTPTASRFDLMTGVPLPHSPPLASAFQDGGMSPQAFAFPQQQQAAQQLLQQQQQLLQQHQQQQFQLAQLAGLSNPAFGGVGGLGGSFGGATGGVGGAGGEASDLIAEQLAIQQQLAALKLQQESLMARFGDMQANLVAQQQQQTAPTGPQAQAHRRAQSAQLAQQQQQASGAMGAFGTGTGMGVGGGNPAFQQAIQGVQQQALPGGSPQQQKNGGGAHGRRQSAQFGGKAPSPGPGGAQENGGAGGGRNGGFGSGFSFPPKPNNGGGHQSTPSRSGGFMDDAEVSGGWGVSDSPQQQGRGFERGNGHNRRQSGSVSSLGGWSMNLNQPTHTAPLAEAQAHLAQLSLYRSSSGHARVPSFGMSSIGPNGQGGPGQLAMAGYGGGLPMSGPGGMGGGGGAGRKTLFAPYLPQASIPPLLQAGKLVIGTLRVNKRNRSDAYVATDVLDSDIYICGSKDRNRALEGDIVAVELLDVDEVWGTKKDKEEKKRKKEEQASYDPRAARDIRKQDKKKDDVEVEGQGLLLFEEEEVNDEQKPQFAGHVVAVLERAPGQLFSGTLGVLRPSSAATQQKQDAERREREGVDLRGGGNGNGGQNGSSQPPPKIIWFRPTDKRVPLIAIPTEQAPADFVDRSDKYQSRLFVACIKRWPITSLHPFGQLVEELGPIGDIEVETNALLKDCNFSNEDFAESVNKCLPPTPWAIPERETQPDVRRDLRDQRVFTIDPETAKDLDDALHIVRNEDGTFEVGVHIADVSHFVKPNTPLDREARKRATTVYLVQRAVPMLPPTLSEELCSLNAGSDKLTFSVIFTMTPEGKIVKTWFGKTVINSKVKLAYSDAQEVIEGRGLPEHKITDDAALREGVENDVKALAGIAKHLRARRFDNGALRIDNVKVSFRLDEVGMPVDSHAYERKEANELIEEFMLLANISVAGKIASGLPDQSLLRRHESPIDRRLDAFVARMGRLGIKLDSSSSGALMKSIANVTDPSERLTLQHLSTRSMQRAKYFCTGMLDISKYSHYALNVPLYTHFTSPIRRYADIMVHRQLEAVLAAQATTPVTEARFPLDAEAVSKVAQTCNIKKEAARLAQEQSQHLFLCHLIADLTKRYGPVIRYGTVIGVLDQAFDVLVSEFGVEKRVHVDQMPTESTVHNEHDNSLQIFWQRGVDVLSYLAQNNSDEHLQRLKAQAQHHARMMEAESGKAAGESALFDDDEDEDAIGGEGDEGAKFKERGPIETEQHKKSAERKPLRFEGLSTENGHCSQTIKELHEVPVCIAADLSKSPPVIKVFAVSPFA